MVDLLIPFDYSPRMGKLVRGVIGIAFLFSLPILLRLHFRLTNKSPPNSSTIANSTTLLWKHKNPLVDTPKLSFANTFPVREHTMGRELMDSIEAEQLPILFPNGVRNITKQTEFRRLMLQRRGRLGRKCEESRNIQTDWSGFHPAMFYPLTTLSFVWCPVYKAASSHWMGHFLHLANKSEAEMSELRDRHPNAPAAQGREVAPRLTHSQLRDLTKVDGFRGLLIVRHPFDRLVSAFRDKLERCHRPDCKLDNDWYYQTYGKEMVARQREGAIVRFGQEYFNKRNNFGAVEAHTTHGRVAELPSWWEFVQYLLSFPSTDRYDEHWRPVSLHCSPCNFPFTHIIHFESLQAEERLFLKEFGKKETGNLSRRENAAGSQLSSEDLVSKYFSLLDDDDIYGLYKIYKEDFHLFGYQFEYRGQRFSS